MSIANKLIIIPFIEEELRAGNKRGEIQAKCVERWQMATRTFDRYLKKAYESITREQEARQKQLADLETARATDAREKAIMTKYERQELLSKIARGEIEIEEQEVRYDYVNKRYAAAAVKRLPGHATRIAAIAELNKMSGDHAPKKIANTDPAGKKIVPANQLPPEEIKKLVKEIRSAAQKIAIKQPGSQ